MNNPLQREQSIHIDCLTMVILLLFFLHKTNLSSISQSKIKEQVYRSLFSSFKMEIMMACSHTPSSLNKEKCQFHPTIKRFIIISKETNG